MAGQWPLDRFPAKQESVGRTSAGAGFTMLNSGAVAHATPHTKGDWSFSSLFVEGANGILFCPGNTSANGTDTSVLLDIGIEAPGQGDRVVLSNYQIGWARFGKAFYLPFNVPKNSYIATRIQAAESSKSVSFPLDVFAGEGASSLSVPQKFTTYGANTATSAAVSVTPSQNAFGSWTEITASTTAAIHELLWNIQGTGTLVNDGNGAIDIGVGSAGNERIIAKSLNFAGDNSLESYVYRYPEYIPLRYNIPAGVRLAVRASVADAAVQPISVSLIGITY